MICTTSKVLQKRFNWGNRRIMSSTECYAELRYSFTLSGRYHGFQGLGITADAHSDILVQPQIWFGVDE